MPRRSYKTKHYHKLIKKKFPNGKLFFQCVECPSYFHDMIVVGQVVQCWYCEKTFKVYRQQISSGQSKLHCVNCVSDRGFGRKKYQEQLQKRVEREIDYDLVDPTEILADLLKEKLPKLGTERIEETEEIKAKEEIENIEEQKEESQEQVS